MDTTTKPAKTMTCGFCDTHAHDRCPWGVRNGDGKMVICICRGCHDPENRRCTDCGNRTPGEVGDSWRCQDLDACKAEQQARIEANPFVRQMAAVRAAREAREELEGPRTPRSAPSSPEAPSRPARTASGGPRACLCDCGGQTKGGKFLPGHDSKYLNHLVAVTDIANLNCNVHDARERAYAISEAFGAKYDKRIK